MGSPLVAAGEHVSIFGGGGLLTVAAGSFDTIVGGSRPTGVWRSGPTGHGATGASGYDDCGRGGFGTDKPIMSATINRYIEGFLILGWRKIDDLGPKIILNVAW